MKEQNLESSQKSINIIFLVISCISWIAVSVNNWVSLHWLYSKKHRTWSVVYIYLEGEAVLQAPLQMHYIMNYIVFNLIFAIIFIACIVFFITTIFKKDQEIINGMLGKFTRFHFFPLLCAFAMTVLGELGMKADDIPAFYTSDKVALPITLIGLISMIFIYIFTDLKSSKWWANYFLKNGAFSCLIVLFWYNFCYDIYYLRLANKKLLEDIVWRKGCGISLSIIFGLCNFIFALFFKDITISFLNALIYIGMSIYYFQLSEEDRSTKQFNKNGDGIVDIIITAFSLILFIYLIVDKMINFILEAKGLKPQTAENIVKIESNSEFINLNPSKSNIKK